MMNLTFGLFTQVRDSGPQGPMFYKGGPFCDFLLFVSLDNQAFQNISNLKRKILIPG